MPLSHVCAGGREDSLVCVLLDEVESLTRARTLLSRALSLQTQFRAVNALLTQVLHRAAHPELEVPGNMPVFLMEG